MLIIKRLRLLVALCLCAAAVQPAMALDSSSGAYDQLGFAGTGDPSVAEALNALATIRPVVRMCAVKGQKDFFQHILTGGLIVAGLGTLYNFHEARKFTPPVFGEALANEVERLRLLDPAARTVFEN